VAHERTGPAQRRVLGLTDTVAERANREAGEDDVQAGEGLISRFHDSPESRGGFASAAGLPPGILVSRCGFGLARSAVRGWCPPRFASDIKP